MMDEKLQKELIAAGRAFCHGYNETNAHPDFESDQELRRPQPPLVKAPMAGPEAAVELPKDFSDLGETGFTETVLRRRSARVYTGEGMTLEQLSYLLWATQGVRDIRGKAYATLRTMPSGGARHAFETYLLLRGVAGLCDGAYHYLPMGHRLEFLHAVDDWDAAARDSLVGQTWAEKANAIFYWSMVPYRAEWRYGIFAHRVALIDAGHVGENLYLACAALGLGTCGIGAFDDAYCAKLFGLDGEEEFVVYTAPVGTVRPEDAAAEKAFYRFVEDEGL